MIQLQALNYILGDTPFTGESNIVSTNTSYFVRKNIIEAIQKLFSKISDQEEEC